MRYTKNQRDVIKCNDDIVQVGSPPGSGKTATIFGCIENDTKKNFLVLCFNASIREELIEKAVNKDIKNAEFYTFHGFAHSFFSRTNHIVNFKNREMADNLDVFEMRKIMKKLEIEYTNIKELIEIKNKISSFFCTHLTATEFFQEEIEFYRIILNYLKNDEEAPIFHGFYIKFFQLLGYSTDKFDVTLIDEAQDMSSCYISIVNNLKTKQYKYFGDKYQMIYSFNGAVGMDKSTHFLDRSFRLGEENANFCSLLLKKLIDRNTPSFIGVNTEQLIVDKLPQLEQKTIICRTNKTIIRKLLEFSKQNKKCYIIGGKESLGLNVLEKFLNDFRRGRKTFYKGIILNNLDDIIKLAKTTKDSILKNISNAITEFKLDNNQALSEILRTLVLNKELADCVLTTVHKSKGLEFKNVEIADDFETMDKLLEKKAKGKNIIDEAYVLYVATSRSFGNIKLNLDLKYWFLDQKNNTEDLIQLAI